MARYELSASTAEVTESLHRCLAGEGLTGVRITTGSRPPAPDEQGGQEFIIALLGSGTGAVLAQAINTWAVNQRERVKLRLRRPDGEQLDWEASGPQSLDTLNRFLDVNRPDPDDS
jgi:hypothetical protein